MGNSIEERERTLVHLLARRAEHNGGRDALAEVVDGGRVEAIDYARYWRAVRDTAKGLSALGVEPGDCVAIFARNGIAWPIIELGAMAARAVPVPIHPDASAARVEHVVSPSRVSGWLRASAVGAGRAGCWLVRCAARWVCRSSAWPPAGPRQPTRRRCGCSPRWACRCCSSTASSSARVSPR